MSKNSKLVSCAALLSLLCLKATASNVEVFVNGVFRPEFANQIAGLWRVQAVAADGDIEVFGEDGPIIEQVHIRATGDDQHVLLFISGDVFLVDDIRSVDPILGPGGVILSEVWIHSVEAENVGSVSVEKIGTITATTGDVFGEVTARGSLQAGGSANGIDLLRATQGNITGNVTASKRIAAIEAPSGDVGFAQLPLLVEITSAKSIGSIEAEAVYAAVSVTGAAADIDWIETTVGDFAGSLTCRKITGVNAAGPYGLRVKGDLKADIDHSAVMATDFIIGGSFAAGADINLPAQGLTKQSIFAAGGSGSWSSTAHINLGGVALNGEPYYTNPATGTGGVGGGSAGLATFDIHHESCTPVEGASALGFGPHYTCQGEEDCCARFKKAYVRMYGPITQTQSPAVTVKYRPAGSSSSFTAVSWGVVTAVSSTDPRTLEVSRAYNAAWEPGDNYEYLIEPNGSLKSAEVDGTPSVVPFQYKFTLTSDCGSEQGFTGGGFDMNNDGRMTSADLVAWVASPRDLTADGNVNSADLARLTRIVARFSN